VWGISHFLGDMGLVKGTKKKRSANEIARSLKPSGELKTLHPRERYLLFTRFLKGADLALGHSDGPPGELVGRRKVFNQRRFERDFMIWRGRVFFKESYDGLKSTRGVHL